MAWRFASHQNLLLVSLASNHLHQILPLICRLVPTAILCHHNMNIEAFQMVNFILKRFDELILLFILDFQLLDIILQNCFTVINDFIVGLQLFNSLLQGFYLLFILIGQFLQSLVFFYQQVVTILSFLYVLIIIL